MEVWLVCDPLPNIRCVFLVPHTVTPPSLSSSDQPDSSFQMVVETVCSPNPLPFPLAVELDSMSQRPRQLGRATYQRQWNLVEVMRTPHSLFPPIN